MTAVVAEFIRFTELGQSLDRGAARRLLGLVEAHELFLKG